MKLSPSLRDFALAKSWQSTSSKNAKTQNADSRICDEKSLLCERVQGRILGVCNRGTREAIKDLSRKAESTSPKPNRLTPNQRRPK